jgi:hypothetical protein
MWEMVRHLIWFFIVACAVAYLIFIVLGSTIHAQALDESRIVAVRDVLAPNTHNLSGIVMVPQTCAQLTVHTRQISTTLYALDFTTWEEPSVQCDVEDTARAFRAVVFAPAAGITFVGSLDGSPLLLSVIQALNRDAP